MVRRSYRGKYPSRVRAVWGFRSDLKAQGLTGMGVQLNNEWTYQIAPLSAFGRSNAPKPGVDITFYMERPEDYLVVTLATAIANVKG